MANNISTTAESSAMMRSGDSLKTTCLPLPSSIEYGKLFELERLRGGTETDVGTSVTLSDDEVDSEHEIISGEQVISTSVLMINNKRWGPK